jgi:hypothetical protein
MRYFPSIPSFVRAFIIKQCWILSSSSIVSQMALFPSYLRLNNTPLSFQKFINSCIHSHLSSLHIFTISLYAVFSVCLLFPLLCRSLEFDVVSLFGLIV